MSAGSIAIIIASVSALFTGLNMTFSALTYRRVRPKVEVLPGSFSVPKGGDDKDPPCTLHIRLANRGATAVGVEVITLSGHHGRGRRKHKFGKIHVLDEPLQVEPFSGVRITEKIRRNMILRGGVLPDRFTVTLDLANGHRSRTRFKLREPFVTTEWEGPFPEAAET
ncbi:hypothetical protein [Streptomyces sp. NPDC005760]|uniref:hypothetical protein n=1 Tax=Streptomyces sp. NPDC005760 TaxID=3156718 RepID=UPI00340246F7